MLFEHVIRINWHFVYLIILESLRVHDEPLRKAAIEKATKDHHHHVAELKKLNEGFIFN